MPSRQQAFGQDKHTMDRLSQINNHLTNTAKTATPQDIVIVAAYRTAIGRAGKGSFRDTNSDQLLYKLVKATLQKTGIKPQLLEDVVIGNVLNPGAGVNEHRAAMIAAGVPPEVPFIAINRQCSSGLMAIEDIANKIYKGEIQCGLAGGAESMSNNYGPTAIPSISEEVLEASQNAKDCLLPMGQTSENVNEKFSIGRREQDEFAAWSYQKAEQAVKSGQFKDEILPIEVEVDEKKVTVDQDEGPRPGVTAQSLSKIKPAFKKDGGSHAGNASQVSDGAAVVILMTRELAQKEGLPILAKYIGCQVVGVPPGIMGIGPAVAIPKVLGHYGLTTNDVSVFEINEAFAGQAIYSVRKARVDIKKVNPNGGAIALGHPLGATGARQTCTLLRELKSGQFGVVSMCIGGGQGAAGLFLKE